MTADKKFHGWKFGGNLTDKEADDMEVHVDVMTETLQQLILVNTLNLTKQSPHALLLTLTEYVGRAAGLVNEISMMLVSEHNEDEKLRRMNEMAGQLRHFLILITALSNVSVVALDKTLKGDDDGTDSTKDLRTDTTN